MVELIEHFGAESEYVAWICSLQFAQTIVSSEYKYFTIYIISNGFDDNKSM